MAMTNNPESRSHPFAHRNILFLRQGLDLLAGINDVDYSNGFPPHFEAGIGTHIRHVLEHYTSFLDGLPTGRIDYDARKRDARIEVDRSAATNAVQRIIDRLWQIAGDDRNRELDVFMDCGDAATHVRHHGRSSVARELQFLLSHTVHHYALIAVILRFAGREPNEAFGVSPSTIRFRDTLR